MPHGGRKRKETNITSTAQNPSQPPGFLGVWQHSVSLCSVKAGLAETSFALGRCKLDCRVSPGQPLKESDGFRGM